MEQFNLVEGSGSCCFNNNNDHQSGGDVDMRHDVAMKKNEQMGSIDDKKAAVDEEIKKVNRLPPNSSYATHRMRVLNKILQLLSVQRTTSQDEELELLFAGLSI